MIKFGVAIYVTFLIGSVTCRPPSFSQSDFYHLHLKHQLTQFHLALQSLIPDILREADLGLSFPTIDGEILAATPDENFRFILSILCTFNQLPSLYKVLLLNSWERMTIIKLQL